jgi:hypothetical protein
MIHLDFVPNESNAVISILWHVFEFQNVFQTKETFVAKIVFAFDWFCEFNT